MGRMYFDLWIAILFGLIWIGIVMFLRLKKSLAYLIFFTIFYIYMVRFLITHYINFNHYFY